MNILNFQLQFRGGGEIKTQNRFRRYLPTNSENRGTTLPRCSSQPDGALRLRIRVRTPYR